MRKKLIEVALPLDAINAASAREKSIRHGHPSTLHLWWARRPLAAARAVIFAQMVDDPSEYVDVLLSDAVTKRAAQRELKKRLAARASAAAAPPAAGNGNIRAGEKPGATVEAELRAPTLGDVAAELERARLFGILEELVLWENTTNEEVLKRARTEIDLAELAPGVRRERRSPARRGAVRPPHAARIPRSVRRRRLPAARSAAAGPRSPCQRP